MPDQPHWTGRGISRAAIHCGHTRSIVSMRGQMTTRRVYAKPFFVREFRRIFSFLQHIPHSVIDWAVDCTMIGGKYRLGVIAHRTPTNSYKEAKGREMKKRSRYSLVVTMFGCLMAVNADATTQTAVALGSDATFVALGNTTVTVTGGGTITGNIGISPGSTFIAGNPAVTVNGTVYASGAIAAQAQADLTTAYNDAAGRQTPVIVAGNIGGQTLTPGLYMSTSSLSISSGTLTLDAQGNPNAVFIFQIASTLTMTSGQQVVLAGSASAANIFWQVGSSATIGTTAVIHGNILAQVSVSLLTGATLDGRALARTGAVTIDTGGGNTVGVPAAAVTAASPVIFPAGTVNNSTATVNSASYLAPVAAGSIASVFGSNLSVGTSGPQITVPLPTTLAQSSFTIGGQLAPMYLASPGQANVQIPWEMAGKTSTTISASVSGTVSNGQIVSLAAFAPGIFTTTMTGAGQGAVLIANTTQVAAPGTPVLRGGYIAIFCTGLGAVTNQPATGAAGPSGPLAYTGTLPTVSIGGVPALVTFAGLAPTLVGLYQVNVLVPAGVSPGNIVPVVMSIGGATSNTVTIAVQ